MDNKDYVVIYDYIGECDTCYGIHEYFNTWEEAKQFRDEMNASVNYCNFTIEYVGGEM